MALLEQAYSIFHPPPFSRKLRKELATLRKVYFCDLGVCNTLINNFNYLEEAGGQVVGFECKWAALGWRLPSAFMAAYPEASADLNELPRSPFTVSRRRICPPAQLCPWPICAIIPASHPTCFV